MRLQLQDNSSQEGKIKVVRNKATHYVYDPATGNVHFMNDEVFPLSGRKRAQRVKVRKANKGDRQVTRQSGRKTNLLKRIAKRGRKQDSKFQPDGPIDTPDSGAPSASTAPNVPPPSGGGGGGGNPISPSGGEDYSQPQDSSQPDDVQVQPDDQGGEDADPSSYEQMPDEGEEGGDPYGGAMNDYYDYTGLSAGGVWGTIFTAGKGAVKGAIDKVKNQTPNQTPNQTIQKLSPANDLQNQITELQKQVDSNFTKQMITAGVSAAIGATAGYFIAKSKK